MKLIGTLLASVALLSSTTSLASCPEVLDHDMRKLRSKDSVNLCQAYSGKPVLMVNTASHCGFTPQFKGLEALYKQYKDQGLHVAGFPSNSFRQEAKTEEETAEMCYVNYGVTFDMYAEIPVKGDDAHPLFVELAAAQGAPRWNFTKYLVDGEGNIVARWGSSTKPQDPAVTQAIEAALAN
ncbi:MAG: glutathione peroxidase [Halieaceae bacterium]